MARAVLMVKALVAFLVPGAYTNALPLPTTRSNYRGISSSRRRVLSASRPTTGIHRALSLAAYSSSGGAW